MLTAHVDTGQDHLLPVLSSETDRVRHERLRRDLLDGRVARVDNIDDPDFVRNLGSNPVVGERYLRETEDAIRCRECTDGGPELFVVRRNLSESITPLVSSGIQIYTFDIDRTYWRKVWKAASAAAGENRMVSKRVRGAAHTCQTYQLEPVLATARGPRDASEAQAIGTGTLASCC